jgi:hypothetical protein
MSFDNDDTSPDGHPPSAEVSAWRAQIGKTEIKPRDEAHQERAGFDGHAVAAASLRLILATIISIAIALWPPLGTMMSA